MENIASVPSVTNLTFVWAVDNQSPYITQIDAVIRHHGWAPLNAATAKILCAADPNDHDRLVGFHVIQLFPHVEPLWVAPEYLGTGLASDLASRVMAFMTDIGARGFMVVADNPHTEKLCQTHGMKRVTSPVYVRV